MRVAALLLRAVSPPPQVWIKHDLFDALFFLRILLAIVLGVAYGVIGAQGLMVFLSFVGVNLFVGNAWLKWQGIDESEYEDPEKISQSPLTYEGFAPSLSFFMLMWVTTYSVIHS